MFKLINLQSLLFWNSGLIAEAGSRGPHIELDQDGEVCLVGYVYNIQTVLVCDTFFSNQFKMIRFNMPFECPQMISEVWIKDYAEKSYLVCKVTSDFIVG